MRTIRPTFEAFKVSRSRLCIVASINDQISATLVTGMGVGTARESELPAARQTGRRPEIPRSCLRWLLHF